MRRKVSAFVLATALIISLTACYHENVTPSAEESASEAGGETTGTTTTVTQPGTITDGYASLPLDGYYAVDGEVIVKTAQEIHEKNEAITSPEKVLAYDGERLLSLKPFYAQMEIGAEVATAETQVSIPIVYYVYNHTVYAYINGNALMYPYTKLVPIPHNAQEIFVYGSVVLNPLIYNVKTGEYRKALVDAALSDVAAVMPVSENGKYAIMRNTRYTENNLFVANLQDGTNIRLPKIAYDQAAYTYETADFFSFAGDAAIFTIVLRDNATGEPHYCTYRVDLTDGNFAEQALPVDFGVLSQPQLCPRFYFADAGDSGVVDYIHSPTMTRFRYDTGAPRAGAMPNETGKYAWVTAYPSEDAAEGVQSMVNMETGEVVDITAWLSPLDEKYDGYIRRVQWLGETALIVTCAKDDVFVTEMVDLRDALK